MCHCCWINAFIQQAKIINKFQPQEWLLHLMSYSHNPIYYNFGFVRSENSFEKFTFNQECEMKETKSLTVDTLHCTSLLTSLPQLSQLQLEHLVAASLPAAAIKFLPGLQLPP